MVVVVNLTGWLRFFFIKIFVAALAISLSGVDVLAIDVMISMKLDVAICFSKLSLK